MLVNSGNGLNYLIFPGMGQLNTHPGFAGDDFRVLVLQMTTMGDIQGQINVQVYPGGQSANAITTLLEYDSSSLCYDLDPCVGEYDECGICAGPGAIYECGCSGPEEGFCDCDGNMLDAVGVCGGTCEADVDMDGVCDTEEILGCEDELACNYSAEATEDDGSCEYGGVLRLCGDVPGTWTATGAALEVAGCQDEMACNYDPSDRRRQSDVPREFLDCNGVHERRQRQRHLRRAGTEVARTTPVQLQHGATLEDACEFNGNSSTTPMETGCATIGRDACNWKRATGTPPPTATTARFPGDPCDDGDRPSTM